ncbi:MAG: DUF349 domain-containing protein [Proteobacteria bacterium]|nr:DUF349 domain-containing protein [Pseudomonadota bacterium]
MSIFNLFKKTNWQSKDADIRSTAVASDDSEELIAQLANISQNDESAKVRMAATRRLQDYALIANISNTDKDNTVKTTANKILQDWFSNSTDETQLSVFKDINNTHTIEVVASKSANQKLRKSAIEKINKQGLLGDLLVAEKDKDIRQILIHKITKPATLKRIAKLMKNKDKTIFKAIQVKLEHDGDIIQIVNSKALDLCEQMEKLIHNPNTADKDDVEKINTKWQELKKHNSLTKFTQRFEGAYRTANLTFDPKQRDEFLTQQRQQRIISKLTELKTACSNNQDSTWEQLQTQISKYSGFDISHTNSAQKTEFDKYLTELKALRDTKTKEQDLPTQLLKLADKLDATLKHKFHQPKQIKDFRKMWETHAQKAKNNAAFSTLKNRYDNAMLKLAEKIETSAKQRDEAAKNAVTAIAGVKKLIKDGQLADAKIALNKIAKNKKIAGQHKLINANRFEFDAIWNELKELRKWQTWSNDKVRINIIADLKALLGTGTHPDAVLKRMKQANKQWNDMEAHEKLEGDRYGVRNMELYNQFRAVQEALFQPAKKFFEKRSEIWGNELEQVEASVQQLHKVDLIATTDKDLAKMVRDAIKQLRNLDKVPPKERGKIAKKIRSGIAKIDAHLQDSYKVAERRKEKLIEHAQQLVEHADLDEAIKQAKGLQQDWKNAGIVHQSSERKLWKKFRTANDAVFNRIKVQRDKVKAENQELLDAASVLIRDCEKNIKHEKDAKTIHSLIEKFKDDFNELKIDNKGLTLKANKLIDGSAKKVTTLANSATINSLKLAQKYANIYQQLELGKLDQEKALEKLAKLKEISDTKLAKKLATRFKSVATGNESYVASASIILIAAEYLTGTATPDEYKEQRLAYQVAELSKRMSGEEIVPEADKAQQLLTTWFTLAGTDKEFIQANDKRVKTLIKSLFELLK